MSRPGSLPGRAVSVLWSVLCLTLLFPRAVFAHGEAIPCVMTAEDVGNGYEYTVPGIGTFTVNDLEGETFQAAVFDMGEGCFPLLLSDGDETAFEDGMVLDPGSYELRIYGNPEHEGNYGCFRFQVDNDYAELLSPISGSEEITVEENPPLTLKYRDGIFQYVLPDGEYFEINVPVNGWLRGQASLSVSDGLVILQVRHNGELTEFGDGPDFSLPGDYQIVMQDNLMGVGGVSYRVTAGFHLYLTKRMNLSHINPPLGFFVSSAFLDGESIETEEGFLHMDRDGPYRIIFGQKDGDGYWEMEFTRDTVAPALKFDRYVDGCLLHDPVSFTCQDPMAEIHILQNGEEAYASMGQIAANGVYHLEAADEAGNVRDYDFSMQIRYSFRNKKLLIIPTLILLLAVGAFVYWKRIIRVL